MAELHKSPVFELGVRSNQQSPAGVREPLFSWFCPPYPIAASSCAPASPNKCLILVPPLAYVARTQSHVLQVGLFAVILGGTRLSEVINTFLRNRWPDFSRQNYFDEHGIFMGVMWAGPLLILGFTMLVRGAKKRRRGVPLFWCY